MLNVFSTLFTTGMETKSGKKAIILEYCSNGPITRVLEKTRTMSEQVALKYFKQMFEAVKYIHHLGKVYLCVLNFGNVKHKAVMLVIVG